MTSDYKRVFKSSGQEYGYYDIASFMENQKQNIETLPYSIRILLELTLRHSADNSKMEQFLETFVKWDEKHEADVPYKPERVVLQDFTGVPALVDLAAMREEVKRRGGDVKQINPDVPVHLVVDHSVQVDMAGSDEAFAYNVEQEFRRNKERYTFLKWAQNSFDNLTIIPPDTGIIHQVNLEYLSSVVRCTTEGEKIAFPDTLVGTDSHTTMINGLGVLGWGVGGIEAEASMLGQESYFPMPKVVGVKLTGRLSATATATDLALTLTRLLREHNVVGKFVEFYGPGLETLPLANRATIANMAPEYGATCGFFPIDEQTLAYLKLTDRTPEQIQLVRDYASANHFMYNVEQDQVRHYSEYEELDLSTVRSNVAGPKRPQDLVYLEKLPQQFASYAKLPKYPVEVEGKRFELQPGDLGLAAITSCTNTSNPEVLIAAALIAKNAIASGLKVPKYVKTSFSPGSRVVTDYLAAADLQRYLDNLGFQIAGYGCMTCIGNSGKLKDGLQERLAAEPYPVAAIESGNRNFEGRVNPLIKDTYLASPPLVVAYALAGTLNIDVETQPLGKDLRTGAAVYLKDLWPSQEEISTIIHQFVKPQLFSNNYSDIFRQNSMWNELQAPKSETYHWDANSTYIAEPDFFSETDAQEDLTGLRILAKLGDSITTDHISPAGFIGQRTPAGKYLLGHGVSPADFNSYGSRRGNHEVMMRGTLANIRLQNQLTPNKLGGFTKSWLSGEETTIYDAAMEYKKRGIGTVVLAGKDYGMGSSRDWAAKGVLLLGVKAVIAESFERIHRSNLVMMGILPLQYLAGDTAAKLGLTGDEKISILPDGEIAHVTAVNKDHTLKFNVKIRFDAPIDRVYYEEHGILPLVVKKKLDA
ncbi:aconitate hydratase [Liquorilactobacillus sucicola DSM 21376 = JCM 15457]|uniref:Aconitate hydratase n=1 Tax=Liquorilactobacillus sucicola DSM 21376 = JCM 15457 TaxID=1423806 RepID=A0A023CZK7_9LACO|nr:aconitate hydratase AcnA [Liquorilactobacillus sucicola]KRN06753.1 aconitate hydratase [Liquorilactobacillus sucicola DSM 21376 = JCM 15457]GAJ27026.1 aconitate hydratase [Liquorilactobacillus sucicola DSM 21376 = JCM 15457]